MSFARALFAVSSLTMLSRLAGFVRDTVTAAFLGSGPVADAFFVAQRLPNLFRSLFAEGAFSASFVPLYTQEKKSSDPAQAKSFAGEALAMMVLILVPFSFLMIIGMPWLMQLLAPGFADEPEKYALAVSFSQITFPYLLLISLTALQSGILNAEGRFGPGAAAPIMFNLVLIAALFLAKFMGWHMGHALSWAVTLSGVLQCAWLAVSCYRAGVPIPLLRPRLTPRVRHLFRQIGPGAIGAGAAQINLLVSTILASNLPSGAVSHLFYADRLNQLPLGVIGIAVATTLLPILSHHVAKADDAAARHYFNRGLEFCLALGLPAAVGLIMAAHPIIQVLFERGAFKPADTDATAAALSAYAVGVPAFLLVKVFSSGFFARHDTKTPVKIAMTAIAANIVFSFALVGPLQHVGIALANGLATWINVVLLYVLLKRRQGSFADAQLKHRAPRLMICAVLLAGAIGGLDIALAPWFASGALWQGLAALALLLGLSMLAYAGLAQITGAIRWQDLFASLRRGRPDQKSVDQT